MGDVELITDHNEKCSFPSKKKDDQNTFSNNFKNLNLDILHRYIKKTRNQLNMDNYVYALNNNKTLDNQIFLRTYCSFFIKDKESEQMIKAEYFIWMLNSQISRARIMDHFFI